MVPTKFEKAIQDKYQGTSYDELVEIAQATRMSNLEFIIAQPSLFEEFKEYLNDRGLDEYDEEIATDFLYETEERLTSTNQEYTDYEN